MSLGPASTAGLGDGSFHADVGMESWTPENDRYVDRHEAGQAGDLPPSTAAGAGLWLRIFDECAQNGDAVPRNRHIGGSGDDRRDHRLRLIRKA